MHPQHRLRTAKDVERARRRGLGFHSALVRLSALDAIQAESPGTRCAFSVSRRVGKAVVRNRVRRRLREIARRVIPGLAPGWHLVFTARPAAATASYAELQAAVAQVLQRARLAPV